MPLGTNSFRSAIQQENEELLDGLMQIGYPKDGYPGRFGFRESFHEYDIHLLRSDAFKRMIGSQQRSTFSKYIFFIFLVHTYLFFSLNFC
jgi:hypothetical protein